MAEGESNRMQLYQELRQKFPEIPDSVFNQCFQQYSHDLQKCIDILNKVSSRYLYGTMENLQISKQESTISTNHYKSSSHAYHYSHKHNNPNTGHEPEVKQNDSFQYQIHNIKVNTEGDTRYLQGSSTRSTSVSGTPTGSKSFVPNNVDYTSMSLHPQSAPVIPRSFEPFQFIGHTQFSFNHNNQPTSGFSNATSQHPLPVYPETAYDAQRGLFFNQCNYEMHVSYNEALVRHQHAQLQSFKQELFNKNHELDILKQEVGVLEQELTRKQQNEINLPPYVKDIQRLRESIRKLRIECDLMSKEVDFIVKGQVPLGETSEDFYRHINPGQTGSVGNPPIQGDQATAHLPAPLPSSSEIDDESHNWECTACTFLNNPALDKCEICEMPRILIGTPHVLLPVHSGPCYCHKQTVP